MLKIFCVRTGIVEVDFSLAFEELPCDDNSC